MDAPSRRGSGGGLGNEAENRIAPAESGEAKLSSVTPHIAVTRSNRGPGSNRAKFTVKTPILARLPSEFARKLLSGPEPPEDCAQFLRTLAQATLGKIVPPLRFR